MRSSIFGKIKLLLLDVDGVLTKGEIIYDSEGRELKVFDVKDGLGIYLLGKMGIKVILVTAKDSSVVRKRAIDMGVEVYAGILPKESILSKIEKDYSVGSNEICFVGDDLIDIGIMKKVGVPVAVKNAAKEVKDIAVYVTKHKGGEGAVREIGELILKSKKLWYRAIENL
ncbi:MAG: HAD-IIIA family hydrolase [Candidatus Omnitrophica bacterium]|nr:HAD-IIIA family hydrolase [Candidatus Omnitrophota bacterium]